MAEPWRQWSLVSTPILLKLMRGRKRAVFDMFRNHLHLGVEVLTKIIRLRSNGKAKISNTRLHTLNGMAPRTASKITQGETIATLDGVEHRMEALLGSLELVDIRLRHITHNDHYSFLFCAGR